LNKKHLSQKEGAEVLFLKMDYETFETMIHRDDIELILRIIDPDNQCIHTNNRNLIKNARFVIIHLTKEFDFLQDENEKLQYLCRFFSRESFATLIRYNHILRVTFEETCFSYSWVVTIYYVEMKNITRFLLKREIE
jgi:hypothetical protein